jgi:hypothetical protein
VPIDQVEVAERVRSRKCRKTSSAPSLAGLLGVTGILVRSFVDFNLQIPANAALFYVVAAIAAASFETSRRAKRSQGSTD